MAVYGQRTLVERNSTPHPVSDRTRDFAKRYCGSGAAGGANQHKSSSNVAELHTLLKSTIMIRRLKKDILKQLPPKKRNVT